METIGLIGAGRLGLCLALNLEKAGYNILAYDVSEERVAEINDRKIIVPEPKVEEYLSNAQNIKASSSIDIFDQQDISAIFIVVPTPSGADGKFQHHYIESAVDELLRLPNRETTTDLIVNSTTMPGYCDLLQAKVKGHNYVVSYNPEFIAQGNIIYDQQYPDQVLIGEEDEAAGARVEAIYRKMCANEPAMSHMSRTSAEITKLAVNCFLTTKISFANAIGDVAISFGAEENKILKAIGSDKRIGGKYLSYGFGYGGPCLPRDNRALGKAAEEKGVELLLSKATDQANKDHLSFQVNQFLASNDSDEVIIEQVTYKSDTDILEESQQLAFAIELAKAGKSVLIKERKEIIDQLKATYGDQFNYQITENE